eukprot:m51a1_g14057 putative protein kinase domain containing protein (519) ;mRNA; f:1210333-1212341
MASGITSSRAVRAASLVAVLLAVCAATKPKPEKVVMNPGRSFEACAMSPPNATCPTSFTWTVVVWNPGLTDSPGQGDGVLCFLTSCYMYTTTFGATWAAPYQPPVVPGVYAGDSADGKADVFRMTLHALQLGHGNYEVNAFCVNTGPHYADGDKVTAQGMFNPAHFVVRTPRPTCGDNVTQYWLGEQCDSGDPAVCINGNCTCRAGAVRVGSVCSFCGNGVVDSGRGEQCDPPTNTSCSQSCTCAAGYAFNGTPGSCTKVCGNGVLDAGEQCDPPSGTCQWPCQCMRGYYGNKSSGRCYSECGDGKLESGEQCDYSIHTGCLKNCTCSNATALIGTTCTTCGNGVRDASEQCDGGTGCTDCLCDAGYSAAPSTSSLSVDCLAICVGCDSRSTGPQLVVVVGAVAGSVGGITLINVALVTVAYWYYRDRRRKYLTQENKPIDDQSGHFEPADSTLRDCSCTVPQTVTAASSPFVPDAPASALPGGLQLFSPKLTGGDMSPTEEFQQCALPEPPRTIQPQ